MAAGTRTVPHWTRAAQAQLRELLCALKQRKTMVLYGSLTFGAALMAALDGFPALVFSNSEEIESGFRFIRPNELETVPGAFGIALGFLLALIVGFVWPLRVWRGNRPSQRDYFWSLPVDARVHELLRVLAGLAWLQVVIGLLAVVSMTGALLVHGTAALASVPPSAWLSFVLAPTTLYLLNSVAALRSNHPGVWIFGLYYPLGIVLLIGSLYTDSMIGTLSQQLLDGPLSLYVATLGPFLNVVAKGHYQAATQFWGAAATIWIAVGSLGVTAATFLRKHK